MKFKKFSSIVAINIVLSNMLVFAAFADSDKTNSNLEEGSNNLLINVDDSQDSESLDNSDKTNSNLEEGSNNLLINVDDSQDSESLDNSDETGYIEPMILSESLDNSDEKQQILNALNNSKIDAREVLLTHDDVYTESNFEGVNNKEDLSFDKPYKVVLFSNDLKNALIEGNAIEAALDKSPYYWEVPIINNNNKKVVSTCIVDKLENQWQIVEVGSNIDNNDADLSKNSQKINDLMKEMNIKDIKDFAHIRILQVGYDILYAKTDTNEYFIPLSFEGNNKGRLNEKVSYSRDSFVNNIKPLLETENQSSDEISLGGSSTQASKPVILEFIESIIYKFLEIFR